MKDCITPTPRMEDLPAERLLALAAEEEALEEERAWAMAHPEAWEDVTERLPLAA